MKITHSEFVEIIKNVYNSVYGVGAWESLPKQEQEKIIHEHKIREMYILDFD